jgi:hypothetical protein
MTAAWLGYALTTIYQWPILMAAYQVNSAGIDLSALVTPTFTPATGDILVVKCVGADASITFGTPVGGGWTYSPRGTDTSASHTSLAMWTAPVTLGGTAQTVSVTPGGTAQNHSMVVERWANARLASAPALTDTTGSGGPSATNTTVGINSVVSWCSGDWAAVNGTLTRVYRSEAQESGFRWLTGQYTAYWGYQLTGNPGAQTVGLSAPVGQTWTLLAVELQTGGLTMRQIPRAWQAVARASYL